MRSMKLLGAVAGVVATLTGCGGGGRQPAMTPSGSMGGGGVATADAPASADYGGAQPGYPIEPAAPPPATATTEAAPSGGGGTWKSSEPAPQDRPGLGTQWGESRESHISEVSFLRADPDRPFAVADLYYNDWQGVQALAAFHGGSRFHDVSEAGGAITVSIRGASGEALDAMHVGERTYVIGHEGER